MKVRFTPTAQSQFLEAISFIRQDKYSAAVRFRKRSENILRRLEEFPDSGLPEFPELPHREVIIGSYRFFYRLERRIIWIVAVWLGAQRAATPRGHRTSKRV